MKTAFHILILFLLTQSCHLQENKLNVKYEYIEINIPGQPGSWIKQKGKFYCYFSTDNDKYSSAPTQHFYILDKSGKIESKIPVPKQLQTFYYDLYLKNDSLFTTDYYNQNTFFLDEGNQVWLEIEKGIDLFYEDENYDVYSRDLGEWGEVTWFKNRNTNKQYELAVSSPIINKLNGAYFVTTKNKVLKIADPQNLEVSKEPYDYTRAVLQEKYFRNGSNSLKGADIIYEYKSNDYFAQPFSFATSFVANNKLFNIYKDSISTKIGLIEENKLIPVYEFEEQIFPFRLNYDWRQPIQNNKSQTFQFSTKNQNEYGIVEIDGGNLLVTTLKNSYKEAELSEVNMKGWFEKTFDFYYNNFGNLYLKDVDSIEQKENATDLTQNHNISHYLLDNKDVGTPRIYRKLEGSTLKLNTAYYYAKGNSVELIEFGWEKNSKNQTIEDPILTKESRAFKSKFDWISRYLIIKLGKPNSSEKGKNSATQEWKTGNKVIKLLYAENFVELTMYKK